MLSSGKRKPDSNTVGRNSPIMVTIMASSWVRPLAEIIRPNEAEVNMNMMHSSNRNQMLPLMGMWNTVTLMMRMKMKTQKKASN